MENLPIELRCLIYSHFIHLHTLPDELKHSIHFWKLEKAFRNIIGTVGFRNAAWGILYSILTKNFNEPIRYRFVHYEPRVIELWNSMSYEERDSVDFMRYIIDHAYYDDTGLFHVEWFFNEFSSE